MWRIKITLWHRLRHIFGKHVPIQWNDGSTTCLICKEMLQNPGDNKDLIRVEYYYNMDGMKFKGHAWVDKGNPEDIELSLKRLSSSIKNTILARTGYYDKLQ